MYQPVLVHAIVMPALDQTGDLFVSHLGQPKSVPKVQWMLVWGYRGELRTGRQCPRSRSERA